MLSNEELLNEWVATLPPEFSQEMTALYDEIAKRETTESKIFRAIDGLEALIQHNESDLSTWIAREYELNLTYATDRVAFSPYLQELRAAIKEDTLHKLETEQIE